MAEQVLPRSLVEALLELAWAEHDGEHFLVPVWGHQAQWDARQHPAVHAVFAAAYGDERLWVSMDGMSIAPPSDEPYLEIHRDEGEEPRHMDRYQGVLYLTDVAPDQAAFCAAPDGTDGEVVPVPGRAGDLVVWHATLAHGVGPNTTETARVVQYIGMQPPGFWRELEQERADRIELYESGRANPYYRDRPGHDRVEPWPPAELSALGRRLLGLDSWD